MSHCSPQVYLFAEALAEGAVKMGMPSALAHSIASQTVLVSFTAAPSALSRRTRVLTLALICCPLPGRREGLVRFGEASGRVAR